MNKLLPIVLSSIFTYIFALVLARLIGKKLISQMNFFDFVIAITFGSIVADIATGIGKDSFQNIIALVTLTMLVIILDLFHLKSITFRKLLASEPIVLISEGKVVNQNMKKSRITLCELTAMLREKSAFSITDVDYAILENDGHLSVLKKADKQPITPSDMNIKTTSRGLTKDIIMDGVLMDENLTSAGLSVKWLMDQLKDNGITHISEVFYAGVDAVNTIYISKRNNEKTEPHGKYGIE